MSRIKDVKDENVKDEKMNDKKFKHEGLTKKIIGICYKVQNSLGAGFVEKVYHRSLLLALEKEGFVLESEKQLDVFYEGTKVGTFFADIVVERKVLVELKAVEVLHKEHVAQIINYLKASNLDVGLLINFGTQRIQVKRCFNPNNNNH